ncbi:Reduced growth phenotype protein 1 [Dillenia turbinata]|uniref:Reduced growth phenotype protein 1 n=1 Tax=Dillenia turbinata TaxID=194707 RepID=A0AAN8ZDD8_9MAGN
MPPKASRGFSFFGFGGDNSYGHDATEPRAPSLKLEADRDVYRPGDPVVISIEIHNPGGAGENVAENLPSLLVERLAFEIKGIEKMDPQWFSTPKPLPGSKHRRGENVILECSRPSIVSNQIVSPGAKKRYIVRTVLPDVIPPSYKGSTVRYLYYVRSTLIGRWLVLENRAPHREFGKGLAELEARIPLQIWITQKTSGLLLDEFGNDGNMLVSTIQMDMYWKELDSDSDWVRASEIYDGVEEGYDSSRDEIASVSSYNPTRDSVHKTFGSSLSLQSLLSRNFNKDAANFEGERSSLSSLTVLPRLSVAEVPHDSSANRMSSQRSAVVVSPHDHRGRTKSLPADIDAEVPSTPKAYEPEASEGFIRGRSYNIRLDDQVLLRFSPKNSDSTYYFSDMIGGTLTFFHEEGARRCLEVSITLEISETINRRFVHPSRRNAPTITKVQSDHNEVVADLLQTSFLFSVPMDGPMSFSTSHVSVQWALRFEFYTTPKNVDWTRYEHPLLIEGRDKGEWVLPITVHAPPPRSPVAQARNDKLLSLEPLWLHN